MKLFVAHKMTRNSTLNEVHVAATELPQPQLLSQNRDVWRGNCTKSLSDCAAVKLTEKKLKLLEVQLKSVYRFMQRLQKFFFKKLVPVFYRLAFLPRDAAASTVLEVVILSVCPSVCHTRAL